MFNENPSRSAAEQMYTSAAPQTMRNMIHFAPELQHDPDSFTWAYFKAQDGSRYPLSAAAAGAIDQAEAQDSNTKPKDLIERLSGIIDTEDPRFDKTKEESFAHWEQGVEQVCESINTQVDHFYKLQHQVFNKIQRAGEKRAHYCPKLVADTNDGGQELEELANAPWVF